MMALIGTITIFVKMTPIRPEHVPMMNVSALKTCEILPLLAPMARRIPISLIRSITEICVMTEIMMPDTMRETATKAIST